MLLATTSTQEYATKGKATLSFPTVELIFVVFSRKPNTFCSRLEPITLTQATLVFPLVYLSLLYIPTFLYLARISWNKFGKHEEIIQNCVLLVFAVTTNFSLFKMPKNDGNGIVVSQSYKDKKNKKELLRTTSLIHFDGDLPHACTKRSFSCMQLTFETSDQMNNSRRGPQFSLYQSNILYLLYFLGAFIIIFADIAFYIIRNKNMTFLIWLFTPVWVSKVFSCLLIFNFLLWLDFNRCIRKKK